MPDAAPLPEVDLGLCCFCEELPAQVALYLPYKAPEAGTGWGCPSCASPRDGAIVVLCRYCWAQSEGNALFDAWLRQPMVCVGVPRLGRRQRLVEPEPFGHDRHPHPREKENPID